MIRFAWLAGVLVLCFARPALGQALELGSVRLVLPGGEAVLGQLVFAGADSVVIRDGQGARRSYATGAIQRVDVRIRGSRAEAVVLGFGAGLVGMTAGMFFIASTQEDLRLAVLPSVCIPLGMIVGAIVKPHTRWEPQRLPKVSWDGRALQVGFSLRIL